MSISNPSIITDVVNVYEGGSQPWTPQTTNYNALPGNRIIADMSASAWTLTLPATPSVGDEIQVLSVGASTNALTVNPNGINLNGAIAPLTISTDRQETHFIFVGTAGWVAAVGGGAGSGGGSTPSPTPSSPYILEAQAVITAIENTGATLTTGQKVACNDRIVALKNSGAWAKLLAYYGFLGGTASSHAINWRSPGTFNLIWAGNVTHSAQGVQAQNRDGYASTGYNPAVHQLLTTKSHFTFYSRTNSADYIFDAGIKSDSSQWSTHLRWGNGNCYYDAPIQCRVDASPSSSLGCFVESISDGVAYIMQSGTKIGSASSSPVSIASFDGELYFMRAKNDTNNYFSNRQYGSFSFGLDFTEAQAQAFSAAEQTYQAALGRQV